MTTPDGCREAVLQAIAALEHRHGRTIFDLGEVADEVMGTWSIWERSTVTTHVSGHMCRDAPVHHWPDLERVARGRYRRIRRAERAGPGDGVAKAPEVAGRHSAEDGHQFERRARMVLSELWHVELQPAAVLVGAGVEKRFDLVSPDRSIVGDAKRYTTLKTPAAKWSTIAEYVWLLQKLPMGTKTFLVFGGDVDVPQRWLDRFRPLAEPVSFFFLQERQLVQL